MSAEPGDGGAGNAARRARLLVGTSLVAAVVLVGSYLAAGGASYTPEKTQDPCKPRAWRDPEGLQEIAQQFTLSALDGAACQLGVSRETLARALATPEGRERFTERYEISDAQLAKAVRAGLLRAVDDDQSAARRPVARNAAQHPARSSDRTDQQRRIPAR